MSTPARHHTRDRRLHPGGDGAPRADRGHPRRVRAPRLREAAGERRGREGDRPRAGFAAARDAAASACRARGCCGSCPTCSEAERVVVRGTRRTLRRACARSPGAPSRSGAARGGRRPAALRARPAAAAVDGSLVVSARAAGVCASSSRACAAAAAPLAWRSSRWPSSSAARAASSSASAAASASRAVSTACSASSARRARSSASRSARAQLPRGVARRAGRGLALLAALRRRAAALRPRRPRRSGDPARCAGMRPRDARARRRRLALQPPGLQRRPHVVVEQRGVQRLAHPVHPVRPERPARRLGGLRRRRRERGRPRSRSSSAAVRRASRSTFPATRRPCARRSAVPADSRSWTACGCARTAWLIAHATTLGRRSAATAAAPSLSPDAFSERDRALRAATNSSGGFS